jgi:hypothetical protein
MNIVLGPQKFFNLQAHFVTGAMEVSPPAHLQFQEGMPMMDKIGNLISWLPIMSIAVSDQVDRADRLCDGPMTSGILEKRLVFGTELENGLK